MSKPLHSPRRPRPRTLIATDAIVAAVATTAFVTGTRPGQSQPTSAKLVVGLFAPSVEFGTSQAKLAYVQGLAKAIESQVGIKTEAQSFASLDALRKGGVDFAIVDGQCVASNLGWKVLANAQIGGGTTRPWALYASTGADMQALRGKKLAFVATGCGDNAFIDHAMLESEVDAGFFAARVGKPDLTAAVAEVASYKGAQAVFAPAGSQKNLTKVFDTGAVPNPGFVVVRSGQPESVVDKVGAAVVGYGGGGAISGWAGASKQPFQALAGRMGRSSKRGVFAIPEPVRFDGRDVLVVPPSLDEPATTGVLQHFVTPPDRME